jgi:putative sterol carrier protein
MIEDLTARIVELLRNRDPIGFDFSFDLGDDGVIVVTGKSVPMAVSNVPADTGLVFRITAIDLSGLMSGSLSPAIAYMDGRLKVRGPLAQAMQLVALFS